MPPNSAELLERFRRAYAKDIDLTLRPAYRELLEKLGNPHLNLPPVFHVAGTNGKGSTCAFLRAILESGGYRVHVYTSPHLVRFHERIRLAGKLIEEEELTEILSLCWSLASPGGVSYFEVMTAVAFVAFARHPAGFTILETGLGGRLDATNLVDRPLATLITRLSLDHREYLGDTIDLIAREKAGIMRAHVPCFAAAQPDPVATQTLIQAAADKQAPLVLGKRDWRVEEQANGFRFTDATRQYDLPAPALLGQHQYQNAGLAIAALSVLSSPLPERAIGEGLRRVEWAARLQRLTETRYTDLLPVGAELWLDGGHNDSAGEILAAQIARWRAQDGAQPRPLYVILGMIDTKKPAEFLAPFVDTITQARTVIASLDPPAFSPAVLAQELRALGCLAVKESESVEAALRDLAQQGKNLSPRILICGSLFLAGNVLA